MADDTDFDPSTYNSNVANQQLQMKNALAMALMSSQAPTQGVNVGGGVQGAGGFYVPPSKWGSVSSALQKALGTYMMTQNMKQAQTNQTNQNAAISSTLGNMQSPVTETQPAQAAPNSAPIGPTASDPTDELEPIQTNVSKMDLRPKTVSENMPDILKLANLGDIGKMLASGQLTPHEKQFIQNTKTGAIDVGDKLTGSVTPGKAGTGVDPDLVKQFSDDASKIDISNPSAVSAFYSRWNSTGLIPPTIKSVPDLSLMLKGMQSTPTQQSEIAKNMSELPLNQARTGQALSDIPVNNARVGEIQASTAATPINAAANAQNANKNTATGVSDIATKQAEAQTELASISKMNDRLATAEGLVGKAAGTYSGIKGGVAKYFGGGADQQNLDAILNDSRLAGIIQDEEGKGRVGSGLFNAYQNHSLTRTMQPEALLQGIRAMRQNLEAQASAKQAEIGAHGYALNALGYQPPAQQAPAGGYTLPSN